MIRKGFNGIVKDVDTAGRIVTGYFSTFDFKDSDGDVIVAGAFKKTLRESGPNGKNRIYHLWQHWSDSILGKPYVLKEDKQGLYFETAISKTTIGTDTLTLYNDGVLNEHSIGFNIVKQEEDREAKVNVIKEVKLWEGSVVTWGANENTPTTGFKSEKPEDLLRRITSIEKAIKNGTYTDETFVLLEKEIEYIKEMIEKSLEPPKALEPTMDELLTNFNIGLNGRERIDA